MGPCEWTITSCGCGDCWKGLVPSTRERVADAATFVMWAATGRRYGLCPQTVRPRNARPAAREYRTYPVGYDPWSGGSGGATFTPVIANGEWMNLCTGDCACSTSCEVNLPGPVYAIDEVVVDGAVVDQSAYLVYDNETLTRVDGQCWPTCQRFDVEVPGFEVTYQLGRPIPPAVLGGAERLACEYAKACTGGECALPQQLVSLSRQGVELQVLPAAAALANGTTRIVTGIVDVDQVILADNPHGRTGRAMVMSPDLEVPRSVTWSAVS